MHVAVGLILSDDNRVLIARRHAGSHQGGLWEFPGGKVEADEPVFTALCREFAEELGVTVRAAYPLTRIHHDYEDKSVLLDVWTIADYQHRPHGREGQEIRWQAVQHLNEADFPAANAAIIRVLQLPAEIAITPSLRTRAEWLEVLQAYRDNGVGAVQLRQKHLDPAAYQDWFAAALPHCLSAGMALFFNHPRASFAGGEGAALHLTAGSLKRLKGRPVGRQVLLSAACHDAAELKQAAQLGVDLALLSPVADTGKYPDGAALGWGRFAELAATVSLPVYALGGLHRDDLSTARRFGAFGIAGIRGFLGRVEA